jgi:hypothetical protein
MAGVVRLANPWLTVLLYTVAVPAVAYFAITRVVNPGADGRMAIVTVLSLSGAMLGAWRYWSARPAA